MTALDASGGGAFNANMKVTGVSDPRINAATAKALSSASRDWRNAKPAPNKVPKRPFSRPLQASVRKISSGNLIATNTPISGERQKPTENP